MIWVPIGALALLAVVNCTIGRLPRKPPPHGSFAEVAGVELHFVETGSVETGSVESGSAGPAVVLLHGMSSTHGDFDRVVARLGAQRAIAVDRPGYGWSRGGPLPFERQIEALHELIERRAAAPAVVAGHSLGATLALGLASRYPQDVERLVLIAPAAGGVRNRRPARVQARVIKFFHLPVIKQLSNLLFTNVLRKSFATIGMRKAFGAGGVDPAYRERVLAVTLSDDNLDAIALDRLEFNRVGEWVDARTPAVATPVTIVAARDDSVVPFGYARRLAKWLPNVTLVETTGGHTIPQINPMAVAQAIQAVTTTTKTGI